MHHIFLCLLFLVGVALCNPTARISAQPSTPQLQLQPEGASVRITVAGSGAAQWPTVAIGGSAIPAQLVVVRLAHNTPALPRITTVACQPWARTITPSPRPIPQANEQARPDLAAPQHGTDPSPTRVHTPGSQQHLCYHCLAHRRDRQVHGGSMTDSLPDRLAALEAEVVRLRTERDQIERRYLELLDTVPGAVWEAWGRPDAATQQTDFVSRGMEEMVGYTKEEWLTTPNFWLQLVHPDDREALAVRTGQAFQAGENMVNQFRWIHKDGHVIWVDAYATVIKDATGTPIGMRGVNLDITARKAMEERTHQLQAQMLAAQQSALAELSTPLIQILEQVVIMPLIGAIDSQRAQLIVENLLHGVATLRARIVIVDITGVPIVDTQVATALLQATQAVRLLGATVVLTGIRPEIAQTLVGLGVDRQGLLTFSSLQAAILYALTQVAEANPALVASLRTVTPPRDH
jgi:PAS domain S-box-containing protein